MEFKYVVIKTGTVVGYVKIKDDFDLHTESENIMEHVGEGNPVLICDDLDTAAELFGVPVSEFIEGD